MTKKKITRIKVKVYEEITDQNILNLLYNAHSDYIRAAYSGFKVYSSPVKLVNEGGKHYLVSYV